MGRRRHRHRPLALLGAGLLLAGASACGDAALPRSAILVTIDTLRADHLSQAGHPREITPELDRLAAGGTRFRWALSASSYTVPSHASMLLGVYPSFHGPGLTNRTVPVAPSETTLAEILWSRGFQTAAVVGNFVLRRDVGLDQGFDVYDDDLPDREPVRDVAERRAADAVDRAIERLDAFGDGPFFLWLHLQDPHGPYTPPDTTPRPPLRGESTPAAPEREPLPTGRDHSGHGAIPRYQVVDGERSVADYRARYEREIRFLDEQLGRLLRVVRDRSLAARTLVVVTADHGEALGEDGYWFAHSHSVGLDQVHVPLIFSGPGVRAGAVISEPVSNVAVFATILDFLGFAVPDDRDSQSLLGVLRGEAAPPDAPFYTESVSQRGIVHGGVYLRDDRRPPSDTAFWQVNPITDGYFEPLGREAVALTPDGAEAVEPPPGLAAAWRRFDERAEAALAKRRRARRTLTPEEARQLDALGYAR